MSVVACEPRGETIPSADVVLRGGTVYTVETSDPWAEAIAVTGGRIAYVGTEAGVAPFIGADTRVIELEGKLILPGFHDTHVHPVTGGIELGECDLNPATSRAEVIAIVGGCAERDTSATWIRGGGYQLPFFPDGSPSRFLLDSLVPDRPAYLSAADGHSAWVNSRALTNAGIDRATLDPPDGRVERDSLTGDPTGTLRESAMRLVQRHLPPYTEQEYLEGLERGMTMASRFGITTLHEANASEEILRAYTTADRQGKLSARVIVSLSVDPANGLSEVARLADLRNQYRSVLVQPIAAKIFADGVIEAHTAAVLQPYLDRPGDLGSLNVAPDTLARLVNALDSAGFKVHVHAIGDRAVRVALNAFAERRERDQGVGPRHIIAHLELIDPADIARFAELGVVASFQPLWAYRDSYITDLTEPVLGPERSRWLYPIESVIQAGGIVAGGSDWSVTSMNPLEAMEVAVRRVNPDLDTGVVWIPEERVSLSTIVWSYTMGGALASDHEDLTGSIAVGKAADLIALDRNIFEVPPEEINRTHVVLTLLEGRVVYSESVVIR